MEVYYIGYETFSKLLEETKKYENCEMYIAERGWQEWMDQFEQKPEVIAKILNIIFQMGNNKIQDERKLVGILSRAEMARKYRIPLRTLENWESGESAIPSYTMDLLLYTFFLELLNGKGMEND